METCLKSTSVLEEELQQRERTGGALGGCAALSHVPVGLVPGLGLAHGF